MRALVLLAALLSALLAAALPAPDAELGDPVVMQQLVGLGYDKAPGLGRRANQATQVRSTQGCCAAVSGKSLGPVPLASSMGNGKC